MTHVADEKVNKFFRFWHGVAERALKGSLDMAQVTAVVQPLLDKRARAKNLVEYVEAGCPRVDYTQPTPRAKMRKVPVPKKATSHRLSEPVSVFLPSVLGPTRLADRPDVRLWQNAAKLFEQTSTLPAAPAQKAEHQAIEIAADDFQIIDEIGRGIVVHKKGANLDLLIGRLIDAGALLNDGRANVFFIEDPEDSGRVLYVSVLWHGAAWSVPCNPASTDRWHVGARVFRATVALD